MTPTPKSGPTESIFAAAVEIAAEAERRRYVERACGGDDELRRQVEQLIADHFRAGSFLASPAADIAGGATMDAMLREAPGASVGPYKLLQQIGEGGMGVVFLAEQAKPVRRQVALKVIKAGMDSRQVVARFGSERQALALMDHPNIAKVLDAGATDGGRPYFVMELVKGVPITAYCDQQRLTPRDRLALFVQVCSAVQHAHQKGVIHRDLKPSNVLVALYDGKPVPKVIDFGVAKATGGRLTDATMFTGFGSVVGTPEYMSPEQAELNQLDVDTRSDVYSLGVILYELLTGSTPVERGRFKAAALLEVLRVVREEEPPRPSTRLSTTDQLASIAASRGLEPRKLSGVVRGELDWIVMRCLEKDRNRRYETASGLAADVGRYLADEPVHACPPSGTYRLRKFARRNRGPVLAGAAVMLALVAGIVGTTWGLLSAQTARGAAESAGAAADKSRIAETDRAAGERQAKETAQKRLRQIEKGYEILGSVFNDLDPLAEANGKPLRVQLGERLDQATRDLEGEAVGDPVVVAKLQFILARSQLRLDVANLPKAFLLAERAYATFSKELGPNHPETEEAMALVASTARESDAFDRALPLYDDLLKRQAARLGPRHDETIDTMEVRAAAYLDSGKVDLAMPMIHEAMAARRAALGENHPATIYILNTLARAHAAAGRLDEAIALYEQTLERVRTTMGDGEWVSTAVILAQTYFDANKPEKAVPLLEAGFRYARAKFGPDHERTRLYMNNLGAAYQKIGAHEKMVGLLRQQVASLERVLGPDHPDTILEVCKLGVTAWSLKRPETAIPLFERAVKQMEVKPGRDAAETLEQRLNLGMNYTAAGRGKEAIPHLEEVLARGSKLNAFLVPRLDKLQHYLVYAYESVGEHDKAHALLVAMLERAVQQWGPDHSETTALQTQLGLNHVRRGKFEGAIEILRPATTTRDAREPDQWSTFNTRSVLGEALLGDGQLDEAERLLLDGYKGIKARVHQMDSALPLRVRLPEAIERLARLAEARGKPDEAAKWRAESAEYTRAREAEEARKRAAEE